jgi:hypothetical protein
MVVIGKLQTPTAILRRGLRAQPLGVGRAVVDEQNEL